MESRIVDRRDLDFLLHELLQVEAFTAAPRHAEHSRATFDAALDSAFAIATREFAPHNRAVDLLEPVFDGERVQVAAPIGPALAAFIDSASCRSPAITPILSGAVAFTLAAIAANASAQLASARRPPLRT